MRHPIDRTGSPPPSRSREETAELLPVETPEGSDGVVAESIDDNDTRRLRPGRDLLAALAERNRGEELLLDWLGHELRNPLAAIELAVTSLRDQAGDALAAPLAVLERQTHQLSEVIVDLLETARTLSEQDSLRMAAVEVSRRGGASRDVRSPLGPVATHRRTILLVEDNNDLYDLLLALLSSWGFEVVGARDGRSAIELALEHRPSIALIDIGLPVLDGYDVARALRTAFDSDILLLGMSGYGQPDDHARAARAGFDEFMIKPLSPGRLRALVHPAASAEQSDLEAARDAATVRRQAEAVPARQTDRGLHAVSGGVGQRRGNSGG